MGATVEAVQVDLATEQGVQALYGKIAGRPVDALAANAGHGLGKGFLDERFEDILHVINTNITGTVRLAHLLGRDMRDQGRGRILFTGSIAGLMPGSFQAVYNASKAFVDSFSFALRNELKDTGVTVTVLMPGPTDTEFFERAGLMDTKVGQDDRKMDPADVARYGYDAMNRGDGDVVAGMGNNKPDTAADLELATCLVGAERRCFVMVAGAGSNASVSGRTKLSNGRIGHPSTVRTFSSRTTSTSA